VREEDRLDALVRVRRLGLAHAVLTQTRAVEVGRVLERACVRLLSVPSARLRRLVILRRVQRALVLQPRALRPLLAVQPSTAVVSQTPLLLGVSWTQLPVLLLLASVLLVLADAAGAPRHAVVINFFHPDRLDLPLVSAEWI
jgi:hypothetical protein